MLPAERRQAIIDLLRERESVTVNELADRFDVSEVTLRKDLSVLEQKGHLERTHGGAVAAPRHRLEHAFSRQTSARPAELRRMGREGAGLVRPGETILFDSGAAPLAVARALPNEIELTAVTVALNTALELGGRPDVEVVLSGGMLDKDRLGLYGPQAEAGLADMHADRLFLSVDGFHLSQGLSVRHLLSARIKQTMMARADQTVLVVESEKWGKSYLAIVADLLQVDALITDRGLPPDSQRELEPLALDLDLRIV